MLFHHCLTNYSFYFHISYGIFDLHKLLRIPPPLCLIWVVGGWVGSRTPPTCALCSDGPAPPGEVIVVVVDYQHVCC